ncbi:MAG: spermidine synthase [Maioricimonas sp. JB049]
MIHRSARIPGRFVPRLFRGCEGLLLGAYLQVWGIQTVTTFGQSLPVLTASLLAGLAAWALAGWSLRKMDANDSRTARVTSHALLAAWTIGFPFLAETVVSGLSLVSAEALSAAWLATAVLVPLMAVLIGFPVLLSRSVVFGDRRGSEGAVSLVCGAAASLFLLPITLQPWLGTAVVSWIASGGGVIFALALSVRRPATGGDVTVGVDGPETESNAVSDVLTIGTSMVSTVGCGVALAAAVRLIEQLLMGSAYLACVELAGLLAGLALSVVAAKRLARRKGSPALAAALLATGWLLLLDAMFGGLIRCSLWISAGVSSLPLLLLLRAGLAAVIVLPLGIAVGLVALPRGVTGTTVRGVSLSALVAGYLLAAWTAADLAVALPWLGTGTLLLVLAVTFRDAGRLGWKQPARLATSAAAGLFCLLTVVAPRGYAPEASAKLLFSTRMFQGYHNGAEPEELLRADDGRLVASVRDGSSHWTAWLYRGARVQLRENGVPRDVRSINPAICPDSSANLTPAILSLCLHSLPEDVLVVGFGDGATLEGCLTFPVRHVTCIEGASGVKAIHEAAIAPAVGVNLRADDRLQMVAVDPPLAMAASGRRYDVVLLNENQNALARTSAQFTSEYYGRVASKLDEGGLLCQRLQVLDLGPQAVRDLVATMRDVFPQVMLVSPAPGEMLLLGSLSPEPIVTNGIIDRLQSSHVRRLCSRMAWDWSIVTGLTCLPPEAVDAWLEVKPGRSSTGENARMAWTAPLEVMRWAPKLQQLRAAIELRSSPLVNQLGEEVDVQAISQRLADMREQQRILAQHPDHFWAYRKTLKQRLTERPRAKIVQVKHEGLKRTLHPEDQRRKAYLEALAAAAGSKTPGMEAIRDVVDFVEPYDPLVSFFVHQEVARMLGRTEPRPVAVELEHWLHSIYYAPPHDRSVRNITEAVSLLVEFPEAVPDERQRFDLIHGLLETATERWRVRMLPESGTSKYEPVDASRTLETARAALTVLDALAEDNPTHYREWDIRRRIIERELIGPVRTYQVQAARKLAVAERKKKEEERAAEPRSVTLPGQPIDVTR